MQFRETQTKETKLMDWVTFNFRYSEEGNWQLVKFWLGTMWISNTNSFPAMWSKTWTLFLYFSLPSQITRRTYK